MKINYILKYQNCKTMAQYFNLLNSKIDYFELFNAISKPRKKDCFRFITNVKGIDISPKKKVADAKNTSKILSTERKRLKANNFNYGYDAYNIKGSLDPIIKKLSLKNVNAEINAQHPGQIKALHYDSCAGWIKQNFTEWKTSQLDHRAKQPRGMERLHRFLVALQDWQPGWMVQFGSEQWTNWKKGDVITFDWRNVPHATANASFETRYLLKITAIKIDKKNDLY